MTRKIKYFIVCPPVDKIGGLLYIWGAGLRPRTPGLYQFSNLRIAAVIRPEIVPARMSAARLSILLGAVGFRLRRFFLPILTTPLLFIIIYLYKYIYKTENHTNLYKYICLMCILAQV